MKGAYGSLKCSFLIHAAAPITGNLAESVKVMNRMIPNILNAAEDCKAKSIAIPAIGTGTKGFPKEKFAAIIVEQIYQYAELSPTHVIGI